MDVLPFIRQVGPSIALGKPNEEVPCHILTPQLLDHIVTGTNSLGLSATHSAEGPPPTWERNVSEMKAYLGFAILMGINRPPEVRDYWSTTEVLHNFSLASHIPRKRFLELTFFLHFANNDDIMHVETGYDRLAKVRPLLTALRESFLSC